MNYEPLAVSLVELHLKCGNAAGLTGLMLFSSRRGASFGLGADSKGPEHGATDPASAGRTGSNHGLGSEDTDSRAGSSVREGAAGFGLGAETPRGGAGGRDGGGSSGAYGLGAGSLRGGTGGQDGQGGAYGLGAESPRGGKGGQGGRGGTGGVGELQDEGRGHGLGKESGGEGSGGGDRGGGYGLMADDDAAYRWVLEPTPLAFDCAGWDKEQCADTARVLTIQFPYMPLCPPPQSMLRASILQV